MSTATRVPQTSVANGDELSADDAWSTLRRYGGLKMARDSFVRFRYADGFTSARALGLQLCLAIIPLLIAVLGLAAVVHQAKAATVLVDTMVRLLPGRANDPLSQTLRSSISHGQNGPLALVLGLLVALISLTTAMGQIERGINRIYGVERDRPTLRKYAVAFGNAITAGIASLLGFVIVVAGAAMVDAAAAVYHWSADTKTLLGVLRWPVGILLALASITALLRHAPRRRQPGYSWLAVGAAVALVLWVGFSLLLALYVDRSSSFDSTYGPLTGVFALLLWANLTSTAIFLGAAFAAQLEAVRAGQRVPAKADPEPALARSAMARSA